MPSVPTDVNLTDAAAMVIMAETVGGTAADAAIAVWEALTGLGDREQALAYARELLARGHDMIAALPPF
jgi:hypothetical protein